MEVKLKSPCSYCGYQTHYNKGKWSAEEDRRLIDAIFHFGEREWRNKPSEAGIERCGLSCKNRWFYHLRPDIFRGKLSKEEEEQMIKLHSIHGNSWSSIAKMMPGRTAKWIRRRCLTAKVRRRLQLMGAEVAIQNENQNHQVQRVKLQPAPKMIDLNLTLRPPSPHGHACLAVASTFTPL